MKVAAGSSTARGLERSGVLAAAGFDDKRAERVQIRQADVDILLRLYELYDRRREALLWFLHELNAKSYAEYKRQYAGTSRERAYFTSVCGFFELAGVLLKGGFINRDLLFDVFNPSPFWARARPIVEEMRNERAHIYENFELLALNRKDWARTRPAARSKRLG